MKEQFLSLFVVLFCIPSGVASTQCERLFGPMKTNDFYEEVLVVESSNKNGTLGFIDYFEDLLQQQKVGVSELDNIIHGLDQNEMRNPIFIKDKETNSDSLVVYNIFQEYLDKAELNREQIRDWAQKRLEKIKKANKEKFIVSEKTKSSFYMPFFPISSNIRKLDNLFLKIKNKIYQKNNEEQLPVNHQYELMSTMVTQEHWIDYMKKLPLGLRGFRYGQPVNLDPDRAVTAVSWWSVLEFANRKSLSEGLEPAYDFSDIDFEGSAEDGTLNKKSGKLKISAPDGDILRSEGYRLLTVSELNNILGKIKNKLQYVKQIDELFVQTTGQEGVARMENPWNVKGVVPITVDSSRFYDLLGIAKEWLYDNINEYQVSEKKSIYDTYKVGDNEFETLIKFGSNSTEFSSNGFRLVRTITEDKK